MMDAIEYFKGMRKRLCEDHLKLLPQKSVGYQATLIEMSFYDAAIKALETQPLEDYAIGVDNTGRFVKASEIFREPCTDAISRRDAMEFLKKPLSMCCMTEYLENAPSVTQAPKNVNDVLEEIKADLQTLADDEWNQQVMASKGLEFAIEIIENYQMAMMEGVEE